MREKIRLFSAPQDETSDAMVGECGGDATRCMTGFKGEKIIGLYLSEEESNRTSCSFVNVAVKLSAFHSIKWNVNALEKYEWQWICTLRTAVTLFGGETINRRNIYLWTHLALIFSSCSRSQRSSHFRCIYGLRYNQQRGIVSVAHRQRTPEI